MMSTCHDRSLLASIFLLGYAVLLWQSLRDASQPSIACSDEKSRACVRPLVTPGNRLTLELWMFQSSTSDDHLGWKQIKTCVINVTLQAPGLLPQEVTTAEENCTFALPNVSRIRWSDKDSRKGGPLHAKFLFRQIEPESERIGNVVAEVTFQLTRIVEGSLFGDLFSTAGGMKARRNLLEEPMTAQDGNQQDTVFKHKYVPYLKYGSEPIVLRFVADYRPYGGPPYVRNDGIELSVVPWNRTAYRPRIFVDDNSLLRSSQRELAPPEEGLHKPPVTLRIQIGTLSPIRDVLHQQLTMGLSIVESMLPGGELDEIRYWLRDERLYRFFLTQIISFVHLWVDYLAFRDEIRFYRGKASFAGVSVSSVVTRLLCSIIIFLYLLDGGGTSWVILLSVFGGVAVDSWKAFKLLRPTFRSRYPFVAFRAIENPMEQATAQYDRIAIKYLAMLLYPLVIGWAIYALKHYMYKSWYSWLISNLANAVYTFGFIALCPQLYVNYRLKSVAHMPWKVFLYKVFNTFVDDVFAFLIDMPWKHRIMTLRDDVVFVIFLVQAFLYRVDKTRPNEFGYAYEDAKAENASENHILEKVKLE